MRRSSLIVSPLLWAVCCAPLVALMLSGLSGDLRESAHSLWTELPRLLPLLGRSCTVVTVALFVGFLIGGPVGILCGRSRMTGRRVLLGLGLPLALLPPYVTVTSWLALFGMQSGLYSPVVAGLVHGISVAPLIWLLLATATRTLDRSLNDASRLDGGPWVQWLTADWPRLRGTCFAIALFVCVWVATDISVTDVFMVKTLPGEIFSRYQREGHGGAGLWLAAPFIVLFMLAIRPVLRHLIALARQATLSAGPLPLLPLRGMGRLFAPLAAAIALAPFVIPVGWLIRHIGSPQAAWSGLHASAPEWGHTALLLALSLPFHLFCAYALAYRLATSPHRERWLLLCGFLLAVPAPLQGAGLIALWNHPPPLGWVYDSPVIVLHAWLLRALPLTAIFLLVARLQNGPEWDEVADLESSRSWRRFLLLEGSGQGRWWLGAAGLSAVLSLGEIGASVLVVPPGWDTITVRFFTLIHYSLYADVAVLCLSLMGAALLLSAWAFRATRETSQ